LQMSRFGIGFSINCVNGGTREMSDLTGGKK
jgi:hypothetical protein